MHRRSRTLSAGLLAIATLSIAALSQAATPEAGALNVNRPEGQVNQTRQANNAERAKRLAAVPEDQRIVFRGSEKPRAVIQVFTDVTCPYSRKFHKEVPRLNEMGIEVEYLAFPRSGLQSGGARQFAQVWCAANPAEALSAAKRGDTLSNAPDCDNPVSEQYYLGLELGVQGTPTIVLPDGRMVPGYVSAERLANMLGLDTRKSG